MTPPAFRPLPIHSSVGLMPGKRSYFTREEELTAAQKKRRDRDVYYNTAHSAAGKKFVEVDVDMVCEAKAMVGARALHRLRDKSNGFASHFGRNASVMAFRGGLIDRTVLAQDTST